ncbi:MAG: metal-sulfur cluster assembly factor [Bacteroidales bacterium]|nr:metal-sulfur cluster assembly factor [Bacteroidales bacterium]
MAKIDQLNETEQDILEIIKTVPDPEVSVNIVDLGLIYEVAHNEEDKQINVIMTLSARGCPVGDTILQHVQTVVSNMYPGYYVDVDLVWEPQWTPALITDDGRAQLDGGF